MQNCCKTWSFQSPPSRQATIRGSAKTDNALKENTTKFLKTPRLKRSVTWRTTARYAKVDHLRKVSVENNSHSQQERRAHLRFEGLALSERKKGSAPSGCASKQARALTHIREEEAEDREDLPLRESLSSCCLLASIFSSETRMISSVRSSPCSISAWNWST